MNKFGNSAYRLFACFTLMAFVLTTVYPASVAAQDVKDLPTPGSMVRPSGEFVPPLLKGIKIYPDNPFRFDFYIDTGDAQLSDEEFSQESHKLIKYFLAALTVPEEDMWVNLSPYEGERIIPRSFGLTELGRDLLAQDYLLKQITASLIYPEDEIGGRFWEKVYYKAYQMFGTTNVPINTFNKVWIVPKDSTVYEKGETAFLLDSRLSVMLEQDYFSLKENLNRKDIGTDRLASDDVQELSGLSSSIVKEVIIPELEKEVNHGKNFRELRQIHASLVMATWFKKRFRESFLGINYVDRKKISGVDVEDKLAKEKIYDQYLEAFRKGVYNFIKEDYDRYEQESIPRKYFSGGYSFRSQSPTDYVSSVAYADFSRSLRGGIRKVRAGFIETYGDHQEVIDKGIVARGFNKRDAAVEAVPVGSTDDPAVQIALGQADDLDKTGQLSELLMRLVNRQLPGRYLKNRPQLNRMIVNDPTIVIPGFGHSSDRGMHLIIPKGSDLETDYNKQAAIIIYELFAFMGQDATVNTAFQVLTEAQQESPDRSFAELLTDPKVNLQYQIRLYEQGYADENSEDLPQLNAKVQEGLRAVRQHLRENNGRRRNLLTRLSKRERRANVRQRDYLRAAPVPSILALERLKFKDPVTGELNQDLTARSQQLDERYQDFMKSLAKATMDSEVQSAMGDDARRYQLRSAHYRAELERMRIVSEWYDIGKLALDLEGKDKAGQYRNYLVALIAFKKVSEMQPLLRSAYGDSVLASEYKPPREVIEDMLTEDKTRGDSARMIEELRGDTEAYIKTLDKIKDAEQRYNDAFKFYWNQVEAESSAGTAAVENIVYDLGISDTKLYMGLDNKDGRSSGKLMDIALSLRELMFTHDPRVDVGMKSQAALYLGALFSVHNPHGLSRKKLDVLGGGLAVPEEVYALDIEGKSVAEMKRAEEIAFNTYLAELHNDTQDGYSVTAMDWIHKFYRKLAEQFRIQHLRDAHQLEMKKHRPELAAHNAHLAQMGTLDEMLAYYRANFAQATEDFRPDETGQSANVGSLTEEPVRVELSVGGIGDGAPLSIYRPHLYKILNMAGLLSREDGTVGRNIEVFFDIRNREDMDEVESFDDATGEVVKKKPFLAVHSLDMGWTEPVFNANDAIKKTNADLILQTLVSIGLFPQKLMERAKAEEREVETLEEIFKHVFGENKGLMINVHVKDIQPGSGVAVSSLLSVGTATAFDAVLGVQPERSPTEEYVNRLKVKVREEGYYSVEVSRMEDFSGKVYRFATKAHEGTIEHDLSVDQLPTGDGTYHVRVRKIQDTVDDLKDIDEERWFPESIDTSEWLHRTRVDIAGVPQDGGQPLTNYEQGISIERFTRKFQMYDDLKTVSRGIVNSQDGVIRRAEFAGTQDEVSGSGGMAFLFAGDPIEGNVTDEDGTERWVSFAGGIVPNIERVPLTKEAIEAINKAVGILRVGLTDPAEDTLVFNYINAMLNATREHHNAFAQVSIEMMKAAQLGDVLAMGDWAYRGVALRQQSAHVSIHPIPLKVLESFVQKYGKSHGFRYGISGARSTGATLTFMDPKLDTAEIKRVRAELAEAMAQAIAKAGKFGAREDDPHVFENSRIADRGTRVRKFTQEERDWHHNRVTEANTALKVAERRRNAKRFALYKPDEVAEIEERYHARSAEAENPAMRDERPAVTLDETLSEPIQAMLADNETRGIRGLTPEDFRKLEQLREESIKRKFNKFKAPGANEEVRRLVRERLARTLGLLTEAGLNAEDERVYYAAVASGVINPLWEFPDKDYILFLLDKLKNEEFDVVREAAVLMEGRNRSFNSQLDRARQDYLDAQKNGLQFMTPEFRRDLQKEISDIQSERQALETQMDTNPQDTPTQRSEYEDAERRYNESSLLLDMLTLVPNPEALPYGHFLYDASTTYARHFGDAMQTLGKGTAAGAQVFVPLSGGMGGRLGGAKVKATLPFHFGDESDASFLKLMIRRWADFLSRFPEQREGFLHVQVSAFTEDAIGQVLEEYLQAAGIASETVAMTSQGLRQVVRPTELELILDLALRSTSTEAEYNELKRVYDRYIRKTNEELAKAKEDDPTIQRPRYVDEGLNALNQYSPSGNAGVLEAMLQEQSATYTKQGLLDMGYELDGDMLAAMESTPEGLSELEVGMTLVKASVLVKGQGMAVGILQNQSSLAPVGGNDLALGTAMHTILNEAPDTLAVTQYANVAAGSDVGGILVEKVDTGAIASLEGADLNFAKHLIYQDDHSAISTATVVVNLKKFWRLLGYESAADYVRAPDEEIRARMAERMNKTWPRTYTFRERKEEKPGETLTWPIVQMEVVLQSVLTWVQEEFGLDTVKYQEVTADIAYRDVKTRDQLYREIARYDTYNRTSTQTRLPAGEVEDTRVALNDQYNWAEFYYGHGMYVHAREALAHGRRALLEGRGELSDDEVEVTEGLYRALEGNIAGRESTQGRPDILPTEDYERKLLAYFKEFDKHSFNIYDMQNEDPDKAKAYMKDLRRLIAGVDQVLSSQITHLVKVLKQQVGEQYSDNLLFAVAVRILIGDGIREALVNYGLQDGRITNAMVQRIREAVNALSAIEDYQNEKNPVRLAYLHNKLSAKYDDFAQALLLQQGAIYTQKITEDRTDVFTDKDATLEDPATKLKQAPMVFDLEGKSLTPGRAMEVISYAMRGARIDVLTGSSAKEGWLQILDVIGRTLSRVKAPDIMKRVAMERMRVLANDGSIIVQLEMKDDGTITHRDLVANQRYTAGKWHKAGTLLKEMEKEKPDDPVVEDQTNRLIVWNSSIKGYTLQVFDFRTQWDLLTAGDENADLRDDREGFEKFVELLGLKQGDLEDYYSAEAKANLLDMRETLAWAMRKMLDNYDQLPAAQRTEATNRWRNRFEDIFKGQTANSVNKKLADRAAQVPLTPEEQLYLPYHLMYFKDSAGTFGSIDGNVIDDVRDLDDRVSPVGELVIGRGFWARVKERIDKYYDHLAKIGKFVDDQGNPIIFETRAGPGYINQVFGGVSKKNYLYGMLQDWRTRGHAIVVVGDSITDQGFFPFLLRTRVGGNLESFGEAVKNLKKALLSRLGRPRSELAEKISWDIRENLIIFKGQMTKAEYDELTNINGLMAQDAHDARKDDADEIEALINDLQEAIDRIYAKSQSVFQDRIQLRFLVGSMFEMNALERERVNEAGLIQTQYKFSDPNPFDPESLERWGPAVFRLLDATMHTSRQGRVIPREKPDQKLSSRDRLLRNIVESMNLQRVRGFKVELPNSLKSLENKLVTAAGDTSALGGATNLAAGNRDDLGGIDFTEMFEFQIQRDGHGVPVTFRWDGERVDIRGLYPVIYDIVPTGKETLSELLGIPSEEAVGAAEPFAGSEAEGAVDQYSRL